MEDITNNGVRERIIEEATQMFLSRGCRRVTMDLIAEDMRISKRTIYENFADKKTLLQECISWIVNNDKKIETLFFEQENNYLILLDVVPEMHSNAVFEMKRSFLEDIQKYYPEIYNGYIVPQNQERLELFKKVLNRSKEDGYIRSELDIDIASQALIEIIKIITNEKEFPTSQYSKKELIAQIFTTYLRGLATDKALYEYNESKKHNENNNDGSC